MPMLTVSAEVSDDYISMSDGRGVLVIPANVAEYSAFTSGLTWQAVFVERYMTEEIARVEASDIPPARKKTDLRALRKARKEARAISNLIETFERRALFAPATLTRLDREGLQ